MRFLWLAPEHAEAIGRHALADAPREACGMIGGNGERAARVLPIPNTAADPLRGYTLDGKAFVDGLREFQTAGLELIGFYHSHPTGDPLPSGSDIALAAYPDTAYLIVGLRGGEPRLAAWTIRAGEVSRLPLYVGTEPPPEAAHQPLSRAQKAAIIVAACLVAALFLAIALDLLPPAPELGSSLP